MEKKDRRERIDSPQSLGISLGLAMTRIRVIKELLYPLENPSPSGITPNYRSMLEEIYPLVGMIEGDLGCILNCLLERTTHEEVITRELLNTREEKVSL